jgi:hypothetical protein
MRLIDRSCCYSFDDLFLAAMARPMSAAEREDLRHADQPRKNRLARQWVSQTGGAFECEDRTGTDGILYTAFWVRESDR